MAIALLDQGVKTYGNFSQNINVPSGADLLVLTFVDDAAAAATATLNGVGLTHRSSTFWYYGDAGSTRVFYITAPTIGAAVDLSTSIDATNCSWSVWSGVHQTTPIIGADEILEIGPEGTPLDTADTIASNAGEVCLQCTAGLNTIGTATGMTATSSATLIAQETGNGIYTGQVYKAGGGSVTLGIAPAGSGITYWSSGSILFRLNPAAASAPPDPYEGGWSARPSGLLVPRMQLW